MINARNSQFDSGSFTIWNDFAEDCHYEITKCGDLFDTTSITLKGNSATYISFNSIINLLIVVSGNIKIIVGSECFELIPGNIWLVDEQDEYLMRNANALLDAEVIRVEMKLAMVTRFYNHYYEALIKCQEQTDFVEAFVCERSNHTIFESCNLSKMAVETFSQFIQENDKGLYVLKLDELILLKLKSTQGNYLAFHILNCCDSAKQNFLNFIENNVLNDWPLATYAKNLGMSLTSFKAMFKQVFIDSSPKSWINERRLRHANKLLRTTRKRMIDIAMESGFSSQSYFTQSYKARFGCCPSDVRNQKNLLKRM